MIISQKTAIDPLFFSNGDILFVPKIGDTVAIKGEIKQPAIYEVLPGETVLLLSNIPQGLV